jgi:hypothetical protein
MHSAKIYSTEQRSTKPNVLELETGGSNISRGSDDLGKITAVEPMDWRTSLIHYLGNLGHVIDTKVRRQVLKYILLDHDLHH